MSNDEPTQSNAHSYHMAGINNTHETTLALHDVKPLSLCLKACDGLSQAAQPRCLTRLCMEKKKRIFAFR